MENKSLKNWLSFSKKERNALIILIVLIGIFFLVPYCFPKKETVLAVKETIVSPDNHTEATHTAQMFSFDPNTIDSIGWKRLGLRGKTIRTIIHYREKGGRFRTPEDIRKIYGLNEEEADRLEPYIRIGKSTRMVVSTHANSKTGNNQYSFPLEVNKAGVEHWAALPGISSRLAERIVHYRSVIKGFKNIDQIGKTYGLSQETFAQIKPLLRLTKEDVVDTNSMVANYFTEKETVANSTNKIPTPEKININTASEQEFLSQKRIPRNVAKAIVIYREQHGLYQQVADIKKIVFVNEGLFARVSPYLKVE